MPTPWLSRRLHNRKRSHAGRKHWASLFRILAYYDGQGGGDGSDGLVLRKQHNSPAFSPSSQDRKRPRLLRRKREYHVLGVNLLHGSPRTRERLSLIEKHFQVSPTTFAMSSDFGSIKAKILLLSS